jgi:DNA repair exonuclease SbcCD nuclease subunit
MKILFIGDLHLRHTHLQLSKNVLNWIEKIVIEKKPDIVVNLGDTFDTHSVIRSEILCIFYDHLLRVSNILKNNLHGYYVCLLGNHDQYKPNSSEYHAFRPFSSIKNVIVVDSDMQYDGISYVPYVASRELWPETKTDIVVTHNTFIGADYGYKLADHGIETKDVNANFVISGHIHKRQTLDSKIHYAGTPYAMSASDADQVKGLTIFDTESYRFEFIESPFPMYKTIEQSTNEPIPDLDEFNYWIMTLKGPRAEIKSILESKQINDLRKRSNLIIKTESIDKIKSEKVSIFSTSISSMLDEYLEKVYKGSQDKEKIKKIILQNAGVK